VNESHRYGHPFYSGSRAGGVLAYNIHIFLTKLPSNHKDGQGFQLETYAETVIEQDEANAYRRGDQGNYPVFYGSADF
jgi:hypothetical protein